MIILSASVSLLCKANVRDVKNDKNMGKKVDSKHFLRDHIAIENFLEISSMIKIIKKM